MRRIPHRASAVVLSALLLGALALVSIPAPAKAVVVTTTYSPSFDAVTRESQPDDHIPDDTTLDGVRTSPFTDDRRIFMQFDVSDIPRHATVISANLFINQSISFGAASFLAGFHVVTSSYGIGTAGPHIGDGVLTWNQTPSFASAFLTASIGTGLDGNQNHDLFAAVDFWLKNANNGIMVKAQDEGGCPVAATCYAIWDAQENAVVADRPLLTVQWEDPVQDAFSSIVNSVFPLVILLAVLGAVMLGAAARWGSASEWSKWLVLMYVAALIVVTLIIVGLFLPLL